MEKEIRTSVKYATTAHEIWADLKERFGNESAPRAYELKQSLSTIKQEGMSVSAYYTKLRGLWDEIQYVFPVPVCDCNKRTCNIEKKLIQLRDKEKLYEFLLGLDSEFGTIRTQILAMQPTPNLKTAFHLVIEDEQQRAVSAARKNTTDSAAFKASVPVKRAQGQSQNKFIKRDDVKPNAGEPVGHCDFCGKNGHTKDGCFKLVGYSEWWPGKVKPMKPKAACVESNKSPIPGLNEEQYQQFISFFGNTGQTTKDEIPVANLAGLTFEGIDWSG